MEGETKISVIVPVYNTEQYIWDCVKSVLKQTFTKFELILIDDGSQDNSRKICEKVSEKDKRIRLLHQEHRGVSAARNAGINMARGEYLFFLDSDDMIHPQLLEAQYKLLKKTQAAIATVGLYYGGGGKYWKPLKWKTKTDYMEKSRYFTNDKVSTRPGNDKIALFCIGGKMIRREAVRAIRFDEKITKGEDIKLLSILISDGADVAALFMDWYYYRKGRTEKRIVYSIEECRNIYKIQEAVRNFEIENNKISDAVGTEWCLLCNMVVWYEMGKKNHDTKLERYVKKLIKSERESEIFSKVDWLRRTIFYLGCINYPLYKCIADIMYLYHTRIEYRALSRGNRQKKHSKR